MGEWYQLYSCVYGAISIKGVLKMVLNRKLEGASPVCSFI